MIQVPWETYLSAFMELTVGEREEKPGDGQ